MKSKVTTIFRFTLSGPRLLGECGSFTNSEGRIKMKNLMNAIRKEIWGIIAIGTIAVSSTAALAQAPGTLWTKTYGGAGEGSLVSGA